MLVKDICTRNVVTATESDSIVTAARLMREHHIGDVVVVAGPARNLPLGIVTDRDLVIGVLALAPERAQQLGLGDIMKPRELVTVREDAELSDALQQMWKAAVRRLAVVDADGTLVGVLSVDDAFVALADDITAIAHMLRSQPLRERRERS